MVIEEVAFQGDFHSSQHSIICESIHFPKNEGSDVTLGLLSTYALCSCHRACMPMLGGIIYIFNE